MRKEIGESVPIKLIKRIIRNYWRISANKIDKKNNQKLWQRKKTYDNHKRCQKVKYEKEILFMNSSKLSKPSFPMSIMRYIFAA